MAFSQNYKYTFHHHPVHQE